MQNKPSKEIQYITAGKTGFRYEWFEFLNHGELKVHKQFWIWWSTHLNRSGWVVQWFSSLAAMAILPAKG